MFLEESIWIKEVLSDLLGGRSIRIVDVGSQTEQFRRDAQPYIHDNIYAPLERQGSTIVSLDRQHGHGIDVVGDVTSSEFEPGDIDLFDLVLCTNLLEHVTDRKTTIQNIVSMVRPGGSLVLTVPKRFPYHEDPIDTLFRPSPAELTCEVQSVCPGFVIEGNHIAGIHDRQWYLSRKAQLRRYVRFLRWETSCIVGRVE